MPRLPLVLGWLALAAGPAPAVPGGAPPQSDAAALVDLARLGPERKGSAPPAAGELEPAGYVVEAGARSTQVFLLPPGPRTVRALEVVPTPATADAWRAARLRLTWEGDDPDPGLAGVDLPLGLAFGRAGGVPPVESAAVGTAGPAWVNRFPMPYRTGALLRVDSDAPIEGRIRVVTSRGAAADAGYFRAAVTLGAKADRVADAGPGKIVGLFYASEQGDPRPGATDPGRLTLDGRPGGPLADVLGLDRPTTASPERGVRTRRAGVSGGKPRGLAAYRWFLDDPLPFERSFAVGTDQDKEAAPRDRGVMSVFWYSARPGPHAPGVHAPPRDRGSVP